MNSHLKFEMTAGFLSISEVPNWFSIIRVLHKMLLIANTSSGSGANSGWKGPQEASKSNPLPRAGSAPRLDQDTQDPTEARHLTTITFINATCNLPEKKYI